MSNLIAPEATILLPCITLHRPWADWVALGWKTIETRLHARFAKLKGQRIGIHAGLHWDNGAEHLARPYLTTNRWLQTNEFSPLNAGHILCTAMVQHATVLDSFDSEAALIDCGTTKRFGLILTDVHPLPICEATRVTGRQGIFNVRLPAAIVDGRAQ